VRKYGEDNIGIELFVCVSEAHALAREVELIAALREQGYTLTNMTSGGEGVCGRPQGPEERAKRGAAIKAAFAKNGKAPMPQSQRDAARRNSTGNKNCVGRKASAETKMKIADGARGNKSALGHKKTPEGIARMSAANIGNNHAAGHVPSTEICAQWSEKRKAYAKTPEGQAHQAKMTEASRLANINRKKLLGAEKLAATDLTAVPFRGELS
jgi:hypothetical protein